MAGISHLKKLISTGTDLIVEIVKLGKDGYQLDDLSTLLENQPLVDSVAIAFNTVPAVLEEIGDIKGLEYIDLGSHAIGQVKRLIEVIKA